MRLIPGMFLVLLLAGNVCAEELEAPGSARVQLAALNALTVDSSAVYTVSPKERIEIRRGDAVLSFEEGKLAFYQPYEGRVTGFVFSGLGHIFFLPRDPVERQQLARSLRAPVLDQQFVSAYVRFTDETGSDLLAQLQRAGIAASADVGLLQRWQPAVDRLNPTHSLRILLEKFSGEPRHFFHAGLEGVVSGPFDVLLDAMRQEDVFLGQPRRIAGQNYYDVWSSYTSRDFAPPANPFSPLRYHLQTNIRADHSLEGEAVVDFRAERPGQQVLLVQLARSLKVTGIQGETGETLTYFQNEGLTERQLYTIGNDILAVILPTAPAAGGNFSVRFRYQGNVISDAGNGVLFVGARDSWYPHYGDNATFSQYEMNFRWPKHLKLVATGEKSEEHEDGEFRASRWTTPQSVPEAGFNLGEYAVATFSSGNRVIDVYANRQLEQAIAARLAREAAAEAERERPTLLADQPPIAAFPGTTVSPADELKRMGRDIDSSIRFYEQFSGQFPYAHLGVSQLPGTFGQGWPGLLYLSTYSFLPRAAQEQAGLTTTGREHFTEIVPFHEVAHQWWGNVVGWSSYRDQWIDESIAGYLALLFADSQKNPNHTLRVWLDRYRKELDTRVPGADLPASEIGPLVAGQRLSSSRSPEGYEDVIYPRGAWVIHMLREMLRQPGTANPDAKFTALLRTLSEKYARRSLTTEDLQREVEAVMTPKMALEGGHSMTWFFEEYVRGTGVPHYKVLFTAKPAGNGFQIRGKLLQSDVPHSFIAQVPLYASSVGGKPVLLGTVLATGEETAFHFNAAFAPKKMQIDPQMTLLCVPE